MSSDGLMDLNFVEAIVQTAVSFSIRFASKKRFLALLVGRIIEFLKSCDFPLLFLLFKRLSTIRYHQSHK